MSASKKLPIQFAQEEQFNASLNIVRALAEGKLKRDPGAIVRHAPSPVRPNPPREIINPRVRSFRPMSEWSVRIIGYAARSGKTLQQIRDERAMRVRLRRQKSAVR